MHDPIERVPTVPANTAGAQTDRARREIGQALKLSILFGQSGLARKHQDAGVRLMLRAQCGLDRKTTAN